MPELPVACTLNPAALWARRAGLLTDLVRRANLRVDLEDGIRLQFPAAGDVLAAIARTVEAERQCCEFLRFTVTVPPGGDPIQLDMQGPRGTTEFLAALIDA